jgi:alpha-mannosidase
MMDFDTERNYYLDNLLDHLDRLKSDPNYAFAYSEVPNLVTFLQFVPERLDELKQQIREGRVELVNAFFSEATMNLTGGEAIVQLGVHGLRWYEKFFGLRPRHGWMIDLVGVHRQMPQIVAGLGLETLVFCRNNPAQKTVFWWVAPDGTRTLTICNANSYNQVSEVFATKRPLDASQLAKIAELIKWKKEHSASRSTLLALGGAGDCSRAPAYRGYPTEFLRQWGQQHSDTEIRFGTFSDYVKPLREEIESGEVKPEEFRGDNAYCYNAFWYDLPQIKQQFHELEYQLVAAEMVATAASLRSNYTYPSQDLYNCWIDLALNMDRNALWGGAGGKVFRDEKSWDVEDRYASVRETTSKVISATLGSLSGRGESLAVFNPLNWNRHDPLELQLPAGKRIAGVFCEGQLDEPSRAICQLNLPPTALLSIPLEERAAELPQPIPFEKGIETSHYSARIDRNTGALVSLKLKDSGHEVLGGPANVVFAESVTGILKRDPCEHMLPRPQRRVLETSSGSASEVRAYRSPLATTVIATSFFTGSKLCRLIRFYHDFPRIDFETTIDLRTTEMLITVDFPLAAEVLERTRGIPYGFAVINPQQPFRPLPEYEVGESQTYGFSDAILPAVRWSQYQLAGGFGVGLLARGLTAHELNGRNVTLGLFNAHTKYRGWPNELMAGQGMHHFRYALVPHSGPWAEARIPQMACEFNGRVFWRMGSNTGVHESLLDTSDNIIVSALRREKQQVELRFHEWRGDAGEATVRFMLPHQKAWLTNLMGELRAPLEGGPTYHFQVKPQQIVTIRFDVDSEVLSPEPISRWEALVPAGKRLDLERRIPTKGYPSGDVFEPPK